MSVFEITINDLTKIAYSIIARRDESFKIYMRRDEGRDKKNCKIVITSTV